MEKHETPAKAGPAHMDTHDVDWKLARLTFAELLLRQLRKGRRISSASERGLFYVPADDGDDPGQAALDLEVPLSRGGGCCSATSTP